MRVRTVYKRDYNRLHLDDYSNFSATGSIEGMKRMHYGENALLVRCGSYIYNVTEAPYIYYNAH